MKTISISIDEALDARVTAEAKRRGTSKSEVVRRKLEGSLPDVEETDPERTSLTGNPLLDLAGAGDPDVDTGGQHHDEVVYGS